MSYNKHTWMNGEIITAEKMNCMEDGLDCVSNCSDLWTNNNPTADFASQTISVNTEAYSKFEICFITEIEDHWQNIVISISKTWCYAEGGEYHSFVKYGNYQRCFTIRPGEIVFDDCKYAVKYNGKLIPYSVHAFT